MSCIAYHQLDNRAKGYERETRLRQFGKTDFIGLDNVTARLGPGVWRPTVPPSGLLHLVATEIRGPLPI